MDSKRLRNESDQRSRATDDARFVRMHLAIQERLSHFAECVDSCGGKIPRPAPPVPATSEKAPNHGPFPNAEISTQRVDQGR